MTLGGEMNKYSSHIFILIHFAEYDEKCIHKYGVKSCNLEITEISRDEPIEMNDLPTPTKNRLTWKTQTDQSKVENIFLRACGYLSLIHI